LELFQHTVSGFLRHSVYANRCDKIQVLCMFVQQMESMATVSYYSKVFQFFCYFVARVYIVLFQRFLSENCDASKHWPSL